MILEVLKNLELVKGIEPSCAAGKTNEGQAGKGWSG